MRDTGVIHWRFIGDESLCRKLMGEARTLLGTLRSTLGQGVTTGAMTRRMGPTSVMTAALFDGLQVVTIAASGGEELAKREQAALYFALFEMLRNASAPSVGTNQNSLLIKASDPPVWYRDADDAAIYPSAKRYPSGIPEQHALHQYADRRKGVTVSCGFGRIPYLTAPSRAVGVAVNGRLVTPNLVAVSGFSENYCLSPRILSVKGSTVTFAFLCAPPFADMCMFLAVHNMATGATTVIASRSATGVMVQNPAFGFYYSPDGDKCCGVVVAANGSGWLLKDVEFIIDAVTPYITVTVLAPSLFYSLPSNYDAVVGSYYGEDGAKLDVTMKPSSSTTTNLVDDTFSYSGTITDEDGYVPPPTTWNVNYSIDEATLTDTSLYRDGDKWISLFKTTNLFSLHYAYETSFHLYLTEDGTLRYPGLEDPVYTGVIGDQESSTSMTRIARLSSCNLETGSFIYAESEYRSGASAQIIRTNETAMTLWDDESTENIGVGAWVVSVSAHSSGAPWANDNEETAPEVYLLRQGAVTKAGSLIVETAPEDTPFHAFYYSSSDYTFALNSYLAPSNNYAPLRRIPPAYTSVEEASTPGKFADFFIQMLEYWGYNDRRITGGEAQSTGLIRYLTAEQYESHLIGAGALYELAGDKKPVSFAAFNTYSGIHVLLDGVDLSAGQPAGGSDTFIPAGVL